MDGILNERISNWISEFSESKLEWDSYHIDELQACKVSKSDWVDSAFEIFALCKDYISQSNTKMSIALCFELNITLSHRPAPLKLSRQCFSKTNTLPEIYLFKDEKERSLSLSGALYLQEISVLYNMQVYLLEKKDDVYWRWLFLIDKETPKKE